MANYWCLFGTEENWVKAIEDSIWGVREGQLKNLWEKLSKDDILIFYCGSPIGGAIGFGKCKAKFKQNQPLWPDEIRENKVIYPYRWEFEVIYVLPHSEWHQQNICIKDLRIGYRSGLNSVKDLDSIKTLNKRIKEIWGVEVIDEPLSVSMEKVADKKVPNQHAKIKNLLLKLGKISKYLTEEEYKLDGKRLDVIWKRLERAVPVFVFEVQVGGNITEALGKLKHAFDMWNSNLYLIIEQKDKASVDDQLSGTFHEIKDKLTVIFAEKIEEFYQLKVNEERLKEELGLP